MTIQSLPFTQGGQTQLHKLRMLRQVSVSTFRIAVAMGFMTFIFYFWLNTSHLTNIFMLPAWWIATFIDQTPGIPAFMRRLCFFIENGHFRQCPSSWFMASPYCYQMVMHVLYQATHALYAAAATSCMTGALAIVYFLRKGKELKETRQISGFSLANLKAYKKILKKQKLKQGVCIDKLPFPSEAEVKHMMITGTTGSGKTNAFNHLLKSIRQRGDRAVIVDTTGGFIAHFYDEKQDKLLNPFDKRSQNWCLWSECPNPETDFDELADALIPESNGQDSFWSRAARQAFSACAVTLAQKKDYSLHELTRLSLKASLTELTEKLRETLVASYFSKEGEKTAMSIRATLASHIKSLESLEDVSPFDQSAFSITHWIKNEKKGFLFFHSKPKQRAYLKPLLSTWFSMAVKGLMDLQPDPKRRIWFIVDELASLNQLSGLDTALAEARKYGGCFVIGFQNLSQIEDIYNPTMAKVISDLTVSKLIFETVDPMNARKLSEVLGEHEVMESSENVSFGANEIRDGVSFSHQKRFQPLIRPSDIMQLKPLFCYAKIANVNVVFAYEFCYLDLPVIASDFVEKDRAMGEVLDKNDKTEDSTAQKDEIKYEASELRLVKKDTYLFEQLPSENKKEENGALINNDCAVLCKQKKNSVKTNGNETEVETYIYETNVFKPMEDNDEIFKKQAFKFVLDKI
jgi:type IV conjugative transfer system coupling protein TraD